MNGVPSTSYLVPRKDSRRFFRTRYEVLGTVFFLLAGACKPKLLPKESGDPAYGVDISWHGQSCFTLRDSLGRTVVIDPFDETVGYGRLTLRADALLITHNHFDHNYARAVKSQRTTVDLVESTGTSSVASGLGVLGISSAHDNEGGQIHGPNRIFILIMGGLKFVHLGDFGQDELTASQKKLIGPVDVLFVPVGNVTTIGATQARALVTELRPGAVFPMHYGNIRFYRLDDVEKFTRLFAAGQVKNMNESTLRLRRTDLTDRPVVYTLKPTERNY